MKMLATLLLAGALLLASQGVVATAPTLPSSPATQDPDGDADADGLTNEQESRRGGDPNNPDTDNDGVPDGQDAVVYEPLLRHPPVAETRYAVIDLGAGGPWQVNDLGQVLYTTYDAATEGRSQLWQNGTAISLGFSASSMNNSGVVVGAMAGPHPGYNLPGNTDWHPGNTDYPQGGYPVRWVNGQIEDLTEYFPTFYPDHPHGSWDGEGAYDVLSTGEIRGSANYEHGAMNNGSYFEGIVDVPANAGPTRSTSFAEFQPVSFDSPDCDPYKFELAEPGTLVQSLGTISCRHDLRSMYHTVFVSNGKDYFSNWVLDSTYSNSWIDLCGVKLCVDPVPAGDTTPYAMQFIAEEPGMADTWDVPVVLIGKRGLDSSSETPIIAAPPAMAVLRDGRWQRVQLKDADKPIPDCFTTALNNRGEILMNSGYFGDRTEQASLWHNGHVDSLDTLIGDPDIWHVANAVDINNHGLIVAYGYKFSEQSDPDALPHALLLLPVDFLKPAQADGPPAPGTSQTNSAAVGTDAFDAVDSTLHPVSGILRVAKLDGSFQNGPVQIGTETATLITGPRDSDPLDGPEWLAVDPDRFYIQIDGSPGKGPLYAKLWTTNTPGNERYNDPGAANNIVLSEVAGKPGTYRSKPQILVSNDEDLKNLALQGRATNQVHKIALGGTVFVSYTPPGQTQAQQFTVAKVRVEKTIAVNFYNLHYLYNLDPSKPALYDDADQVPIHLRIANERFAQVGVRFVMQSLMEVTKPAYDVHNGLPHNDAQDWPEAKLIMRAPGAGTDITTDISVYYVPWIGETDNSTFYGVSFPAYVPRYNGSVANNCFVSTSYRPEYTLSHELGHIVGGIEHDSESWHIMRGKPYSTLGLGNPGAFNGPRRFSQAEGKRIQSNPDGLASQ